MQKEKWWQNGRFKGWIDRLAVPSCERHGGPAETDLAHFQRQQGRMKIKLVLECSLSCLTSPQ